MPKTYTTKIIGYELSELLEEIQKELDEHKVEEPIEAHDG